MKDLSKIITNERLSLYQKYGGNEDGFTRMNRPDEVAVFGSSRSKIWAEIASSRQDIELIARGPAEVEYAVRVLHNIRDLCGDKSYIELTKGL